MSRVSYFQRFSQRENHATNNTLLVFRYFYQASPFKLKGVLDNLLDSDLSIGLVFEQQVKLGSSVPMRSLNKSRCGYLPRPSEAEI